MTDHSARAHAKKSASGMKRRMLCPGSDRMQRGLADTESDASREGTAQHMAVEWCILEKHDPIEIIGRTFHGVEMDETHAQNVEVCVNFAKRLIDAGYEVELETQFDGLSELYPGWGGIGDLVAYNDDNGLLVSADWKFGRGVAVEVDKNPQLLTYAVGALTRHGNRAVKQIEIVVVQPPARHPDGPIRSQVLTPLDLMDWTADAIDALSASDREDAPLIVSEECRFCKASAICPAREEFVRSQAEAAFSNTPVDAAVLVAYSPERLSSLLDIVGQVEQWCKSVRDFAHHEACAGRNVPGYKLVASRPTRRWKDVGQVINFLQKDHKVELTDLMTDPEPKSPAQMEKALSAYGFKAKAAKELLSGFTETSSSGTVLAPLDDPREPVRSDAEAVFGAIDGEV